MTKNKILLYCLLIIVLSCSRNIPEINFIEIKNNLSRFNLENHSTRDINKIAIEITYLSNNSQVIKMDTLYYQSKRIMNKKEPFLKAGEQTFIMQRNPENCITAIARIVDTEYSEKN